jgi:hypothetical protein
MANPQPLFAKEQLFTHLEKLRESALKRLVAMPPDRLLATPDADLIQELLAVVVPECPTLRREDAHLPDPSEVQVSVIEFGDRVTRRVTEFKLLVPFDGDYTLFHMKPNTWTTTVPYADFDGQHLVFVHRENRATSAQVRAGLDGQLEEVDRYLSWISQDIEKHRTRMDSEIRTAVAQRRAKLLADREVHANIGYPIKRRPDAAAHAVPLRRRQVTTRRERATESPAHTFTPEPELLDADYEAALSVLRNMRNAFERNPSTTRKLGEETIRNILLISLNAQFEGKAAGEVFNGEGKTDILIRDKDRNVFIGECKIWNGPKTVTDMLDQLLGYLVWRDTKAALLLFIRGGDASAVIAKAVAKVEEHDSFKRRGNHATDERYDFVLGTPGDTTREIHLALIPFVIAEGKTNTQP